jgi:hypothetical protein
VLAQEDWEFVRFPAIAEKDERYLINTLAGPRVFTRHRGEALHPAHEPLPMIERIRKTIRNYVGNTPKLDQASAPLLNRGKGSVIEVQKTECGGWVVWIANMKHPLLADAVRRLICVDRDQISGQTRHYGHHLFL